MVGIGTKKWTGMIMGVNMGCGGDCWMKATESYISRPRNSHSHIKRALGTLTFIYFISFFSPHFQSVVFIPCSPGSVSCSLQDVSLPCALLCCKMFPCPVQGCAADKSKAVLNSRVYCRGELEQVSFPYSQFPRLQAVHNVNSSFIRALKCIFITFWLKQIYQP